MSDVFTRRELALEHTPMTTITWLHLSDFHWRETDQYNANVVLEKLLDDLAGRAAAISPDLDSIDLILLTGDLAYAGKTKEYKLARQFLDDLLRVTGVPKERLFIVPGNHDVYRGAITPLAANAATTLYSRDKVNDFLFEARNKAERELVFRRLRGYQKFLRSYLGPDHPAVDPAHCFYTAQVEVAGKRLAVLGLNSAWLAGSDDDRHRLLLGERQVRTAVKRAQESDLRIALLHHPLEWLQDFDRGDVEPLLHGGCDVVLHGHMHQAGLLQTRTPDTAALVIAAGACYETRRYPNTYNLVRLDLAAGTGAVFLRMYSDRQGGFWTRDVLNYRNVPDGVYTFSLPDRLCPSGRPQGRTATERPAEPGRGEPSAGEGDPPGPAEPAAGQSALPELRQKDLAGHIARQYELLREYETARDLASDPKAIARAGREIAAIRDAIRTYLEEYSNLCAEQGQELPVELRDLQRALRKG